MSYELKDGKIHSVIHNLVKTKTGLDTRPANQVANRPATITDVELELLIGNYIYQYLEKPGSMSMVTTNLLSALLELKEHRLPRPHLKLDQQIP